MNMFILLPAVLTVAVGLIMMLPPMRRRAAERGFSGDIPIPALLTGAGGTLFIIGIYL